MSRLDQQAEQQLARADAHDEALAAEWAGRFDDHPSPPNPQSVPPGADDPTWSDALHRELTGWTDAELDQSREPHPHVFRAYERGLFPLGEVIVVGARGREGKTTAMVGIATAIAIEHSLAGMQPMAGRSVVIYSAEDDRAQYARKVAAQRAVLSPGQVEQLKRRIIVPNLEQPGLEALRTLVTVADRQPVATGVDTAIVAAMAPLMEGEYPPCLIVFETASTLSETEEDNRGWRMLIAALKRVARALNVAVALVHHTSQAANGTLADLTLEATNIRGGTALIYNSRQNLLLLNLGSEDDPFPDSDARTVLRQLVAPGAAERITALIAMDTSKADDPAPIWLRWVSTDYGPAAVEQEPPDALVGKSWRKVREMAMAERGTRRADAKAEKADATARERQKRVLEALARLRQAASDIPATARRIREEASMSAAVSSQVLAELLASRQIESFALKAGGKDTLGYRLAGGGTDA